MIIQLPYRNKNNFYRLGDFIKHDYSNIEIGEYYVRHILPNDYKLFKFNGTITDKNDPFIFNFKILNTDNELVLNNEHNSIIIKAYNREKKIDQLLK